MGFAENFREFPYWWEEAEPEERATPQPEQTEVAIVGGGYAGLSAALTLRRLGNEVTVIDAERVGWGASSRNGGMVSGGLKLASADLDRQHGPERALAIAQAAAAALPFIEELISREAIDCDYVRCGRFTPAWTPRHYAGMAARAGFIAEITGLPTHMVPRAEQRTELGSDHYHGGMVAAATGALHPGKFARGLAKAAEDSGAVLIDHTRVRAIVPEGNGFRIVTDRGDIRAHAALVATNGYSLGPDGKSAMPWLARRVIPVASYIIATEPIGRDRVRALFPHLRMISDSKRALNYFRPSPDGERVLWGGRASFSNAGARAAAPVLHATMSTVFPELRGVKITHAWTGNVAFTFDYMPHIGAQDGIHYAAGCQGSGVAMASWLGHNAALKIAGAANTPFALDGLRFPTMPGYRGKPWFLPIVGEWYRLRDRLDRMVA
ncbi:MAG TPA: FAD-binding oxidoreductase [Acetobacteraceae bacterium]|jgi:glycine/D-amino acid oxidase-like deaminating enzyme